MENTSSLMFEMKVLNDLRKMTADQRKEIISSIEREEQMEQEALKKNPNLHLERQLKQVLVELKDLRQELQTIKNKNNIEYTIYNKQPTVSTYSNDALVSTDNCDNLEECESMSFFSLDLLPMWIFIIVFIITIFSPSKQSCRPFTV